MQTSHRVSASSSSSSSSLHSPQDAQPQILSNNTLLKNPFSFKYDNFKNLDNIKIEVWDRHLTFVMTRLNRLGFTVTITTEWDKETKKSYTTTSNVSQKTAIIKTLTWKDFTLNENDCKEIYCVRAYGFGTSGVNRKWGVIRHRHYGSKNDSHNIYVLDHRFEIHRSPLDPVDVIENPLRCSATKTGSDFTQSTPVTCRYNIKNGYIEIMKKLPTEDSDDEFKPVRFKTNEHKDDEGTLVEVDVSLDDSLNDNLSEETVVNLGGCWKQMISGTNHDLMDGEYLYPSEIVAEDAIQLALATVNIDCDQFGDYGLDNICVSLRDGHYDQIASSRKSKYVMSVIKLTRNEDVEIEDPRARGRARGRTRGRR